MSEAGASRFQLVRSPKFDKELGRLERQVQRRVLGVLLSVVELSSPTDRLKPLQHSKAGLWRLRVGDYRVIVSVHNDELLVIALDVGHRSHVYE